MKILNDISIKSIKLNKKRTISTVIGIILSCSLICAVATMLTSIQETLIQNAVNQRGYYHLTLSDITKENQKALENNRDIKKIQTIYENGYAKLEKSQNEYKPYLKVYSMNEKVFEEMKFKKVEGRFPINDSEIIISQHINANGKVDLKIGEKIKLNIGQRQTNDGYELYPSNPYTAGEETLANTYEKEFTIVGVMERPNYYFEDYGDPGYSVITTNINIGKEEALITLKQPKDYKTVIPQILGASSYNTINRGNKDNEKLNYDQYSINNELLRWEAFAFSDDTVTMLYAVVSIVIVIILATSVFCIRNSFAIATSEKMKMYGMLASVGATKKQIKKNVIFEALILGVVGIPVGILCGIFAIFVVLKIVNSIAGEYFFRGMDGIVLKISSIPIILSIVLSTITIYLSAISSAKRASKVSPIDLIRNSKDIKVKSKKLKVPFIISKIFKTGGELAYKNLKRSRKKYRTTVLSITVSIVIFITMNVFVTNLFDFSSNYYEDYDYNIKLYCNETEQEEVDKIKSMSNIEECYILYQPKSNVYLNIYDLSKVNKIEEIELSNDQYYDEKTGEYVETGKGKFSPMSLIGLDDETFAKYAKKVGANYNKVKSSGILSDNYLYYEENTGKQKEIRRYTYKEDDEIIGYHEEKEKKFKVGKVTDIKPYGLEKSYYGGGYLVINIDAHKDIEFKPRYINIQSKNTQKLEEEIKKANLGVGITNFEEQAKEEKAMSLIVKIFLYGFITVITLIGVTNIFNTITSNMELRQKEFAMLKSIGMTKKEFNRMINLETIFYSMKALFYGIALGLVGTYLLYKAFSVKLETEAYIPINPIIISIIAVFILIFVIMRYSLAKINKQNTIETIRNENI